MYKFFLLALLFALNDYFKIKYLKWETLRSSRVAVFIKSMFIKRRAAFAHDEIVNTKFLK